MQVKKQQLEPDMEQQTGSKLGKEYVKAVYCHPTYLTYMQSTSYKMLGWINQARIEIVRRNINNLRFADDSTLIESEEELKSLLMNVKEFKSWLETQHERTNIMASSPITSWQIEGQKVETVTDFVFLDLRLTADGDCSHEIKRHLLLGRKAMTNLDSILKSRAVTLPTKVCIVKGMVYPVFMCSCDSWTIKKAEHQRTDAFKL